MHESPIARQLVEAAAREAESAGTGRVTRLAIQLGPDGGYVPDSLQMHIRAAATGTPIEDAEIDITPVLAGGPVLVSIDMEESS